VATILSRRRFLGSTALAGIAASTLPALGAPAAEPSLETTTIKLPKAGAICTMPQMITEQLLQEEGFTDIRFIDETGSATEQLARGDIDLMVNYASNFILGLDKGRACILLAGVHVGCFVLFGHEDVHASPV
jgi:NitT/TauT family transport system substrate-binding protein